MTEEQFMGFGCVVIIAILSAIVGIGILIGWGYAFIILSGICSGLALSAMRINKK